MCSTMSIRTASCGFKQEQPRRELVQRGENRSKSSVVSWFQRCRWLCRTPLSQIPRTLSYPGPLTGTDAARALATAEVVYLCLSTPRENLVPPLATPHVSRCLPAGRNLSAGGLRILVQHTAPLHRCQGTRRKPWEGHQVKRTSAVTKSRDRPKGLFRLLPRQSGETLEHLNPSQSPTDVQSTGNAVLLRHN